MKLSASQAETLYMPPRKEVKVSFVVDKPKASLTEAHSDISQRNYPSENDVLVYLCNEAADWKIIHETKHFLIHKIVEKVLSVRVDASRPAIGNKVNTNTNL